MRKSEQILPKALLWGKLHECKVVKKCSWHKSVVSDLSWHKLLWCVYRSMESESDCIVRAYCTIFAFFQCFGDIISLLLKKSISGKKCCHSSCDTLDILRHTWVFFDPICMCLGSFEVRKRWIHTKNYRSISTMIGQWSDPICIGRYSISRIFAFILSSHHHASIRHPTLRSRERVTGSHQE